MDPTNNYIYDYNSITFIYFNTYYLIEPTKY